jgi:RIO-like serine/threonine protein kinase
MIIYDVANTDACIAVTDPASLRQIISALKNEGLIKRNCRFASYTMAYMGHDYSGIAIMKGGKIAFALWQAK